MSLYALRQFFSANVSISYEIIGKRSSVALFMGGILGRPGERRYLMGKQPAKYFKEDLWPQIDDLLDKLDLDESRAVEIFKAFVNMDVDCSQTIELNECYQYFGGERSKFTERIFYMINENGDIHAPPRPMSFKEFAIQMYKYCSLNVAQIARMLYEIYDIDQDGFLGRPEIESMYRFVYNCDEHDEFYVSQYPFDGNMEITKEDFIEFSCKHNHLIKPAIDYQRRLRRKLGGVLMWESISAYRKAKFFVYDSQSPTLDEALAAILEFDDPLRRQKRVEAAKLLEEENRRKEELAEQAEIERLRKEREEAAMKRRIELKAPDRKMKLAWEAFEEKKLAFKLEVFTTDEVMERRDKRLKLYECLDEAIEISKAYWDEAEQKEIKLTVGTDADHLARYKDWMRSDEGFPIYTRTWLRYLFQKFLDDEKKKNRGSSKKSAKEIAAILGLQEIEKENSKYEASKKVIEVQDDDLDYGKKKYVPRKWDAEIKTGKKIADKGDIETAKQQAEDELVPKIKETTLSEMYKSLEHAREERRKDYIRKEFDLATQFGSRITRYEFVWDKPNDKMCFINIDNLQVLHAKTAICEKCDAIFEQSELKCKDCFTGRSTANQALYRPLGYKDIRVD